MTGSCEDDEYEGVSANVWAESFEDMDADDWEDHISRCEEFGDDDEGDSGPPDDDHEDAYGEVYEQYDEAPDYVGTEQQPECPPVTEASPRQCAIFDWLINSGLTRPFPERSGFIVSDAHAVRLQDGRVFDVVDWLSNEGCDAVLVRDHIATVRAGAPGVERRRSVCFVKVDVVDAPFGDERVEYGCRDDVNPFV